MLRFLLTIWTISALAAGTALCAEEEPAKDLVMVPISEARSFQKRAVIIGVEKYRHASPLFMCNDDARAFSNLLQQKFGFAAESITLMIDEEGIAENRIPTENNIKSVLRTFLNGVNRNSEVVFYFSGHGLRKGDADWLVPLDGDPEAVDETCVSYDNFKNQLNTKIPRRALLINDACRNLFDAKSTGGSGFGASGIVARPEIAELFSCLPTERSYEFGPQQNIRNGVFTYYLIKGLSGDPEACAPNTDTVTFDSLRDYVSGNVSQYVNATYGRSQNPDGRASLGRMVLAKRGAADTTPTTNPVAPITVTPQPIQPTATPRPPVPTSPVTVTGQPAEWQPFVSSEAKLQMEFPGTPTTATQTNNKLPFYLFTASDQDITYRATSTIYAKPLNRMQAQAAVKFAVERSSKNSGLSGLRQTEYMVGTYGLAYELTDEKRVLHARAFVLQDTLYEFIATAPKSDQASFIARRFFNTFTRPADAKK